MLYPFNFITDFIFMQETVEQINKADVIIIPGSHHKELATKASELYQSGIAPLILPTGTYNKFIPQYASECAFLTEECLNCSVPDTAILGDDLAKNTFENAKYALQLLQNSSLPHKEVVLVLKAFHSRRALLTFQTIFPANTNFYIAIVNHNERLQAKTWFLHAPCIKIVMNEVEKIGSYFSEEITTIFNKCREDKHV